MKRFRKALYTLQKRKWLKQASKDSGGVLRTVVIRQYSIDEVTFILCPFYNFPFPANQ